MLGVGLILLVAVGCVHDAFLARPPSAPRYTRVVDSAPSCVATALEAGFGSLDLPVLLKRDRGEIHLAGTTKSGQIFAVYVRRGKAASAATTVVTVKWDGEPDEKLWEAIVGWLAICARQENNPPTGT
jgi:hypothetical protein